MKTPVQIFFFVIFLNSFSIFSQIGINTTNPKSTLDIVASDSNSPSNTDGILIPRVNNFPAINPTSDQNGLLIYLTTTVGNNAPGFYYWDNNSVSWSSVTNTKNVWLINGNTNTNPNNNYIGTKDNTDFIFRRNNNH